MHGEKTYKRRLTWRGKLNGKETYVERDMHEKDTHTKRTLTRRGDTYEDIHGEETYMKTYIYRKGR